MADTAVVGPATAAAKVQKLETLETLEGELSKVIESVEAEQRRRGVAIENLELLTDQQRENLAFLRSAEVTVVHFDSFRSMRRLLSENMAVLRKSRGDVQATKARLAEAKESLQNVRTQLADVRRALASRGKLLLFRRSA